MTAQVCLEHSREDTLQSLEAVGREGHFLRMMESLASAEAEPKTVMIDATYVKAHRAASSLRVKKGGLGRLIGRTKACPELVMRGP